MTVPIYRNPHEINQIEQIFVNVLRGLGLARNSEAAEAIAIRILNCYQGGVRGAAF